MGGQPKNPTTPAATKAAAEHFVGTAWATTLNQAGNPTDCVVGSITFEPGAFPEYRNGLLVNAGFEVRSSHCLKKATDAALVKGNKTI